MNPIGVFTVIVLLFVIYKFLKMVYEMGVRRVREGYQTDAMRKMTDGVDIYN